MFVEIKPTLLWCTFYSSSEIQIPPSFWAGGSIISVRQLFYWNIKCDSVRAFLVALSLQLTDTNLTFKLDEFEIVGCRHFPPGFTGSITIWNAFKKFAFAFKLLIFMCVHKWLRGISFQSPNNSSWLLCEHRRSQSCRHSVAGCNFPLVYELTIQNPIVLATLFWYFYNKMWCFLLFTRVQLNSQHFNFYNFGWFSITVSRINLIVVTFPFDHYGFRNTRSYLFEFQNWFKLDWTSIGILIA